MAAPASLTTNRLNVARRSDLRVTEVLHRDESAAVIKDPVAMRYHRLSPEEYFVLQQLDGQVSLDQLRMNFEKRFLPRKVSPAELNQLLLRLHQSGLTVSNVIGQGDRLAERGRTQRSQRRLQNMTSVLFVRLPGIDPAPLIRWIYPLARPLLSVPGVVIAMLLCAFCGLIFLSEFERFRSELPRMDQWLALESVLILAAVITATKVLHEFGHAVVCKHFGGECHEIGPMLMVFTPALYCDTSDSWMLPNKYQRAAVGMAGIATEVLIAALATLAWASTGPGLAHYVAMNVMVVCGISTVLFNANPLLRYDGYYVLADLCDTPNMAEESRKLLASRFNRLLFGIDEGQVDQRSQSANFGLICYGVLAFLYRWALTLTILWFVSGALRPYGLESIGMLVACIAAVTMTIAMTRPTAKFLRHPGRRRRIRKPRSLLSAIVLAGILAACFVPMPASLTVQGRVSPRKETPIYVVTPGFLDGIEMQPGSRVRTGERVATLRNPDVELQYVVAKGKFDSQLRLVQAMRQSAITQPMIANDLPAQELTLKELKRQMEKRAERRNGMEITAPSDGIIVESPKRSAAPDDNITLVSWKGLPTDSRNVGCYVNAGQELVSIVDDQSWEAQLMIDQSQIERILVGSEVKLILNAMPDRTIRGKVREIAKSQWTEFEHADRRVDRSGQSSQQPRATSYAISVELDTPPDLAVSGMTVIGRVETEPMSLMRRATKLVSGLFRFR